ncbi:MAG: cation:dicarboxylase symporter family transporter, partial [Spirochaetia bacterium]|nr:cation:dicarboxylase symporter family transporter [Spirochaetia bacterium]
MKLTFSKPLQLLLGLFLGAAAGLLLHSHAGDADWQWLAKANTHFLAPLGQIFLRLLFMIVVPMIFSALVLGIFELGKSRGFGAVAAKTILYTVILSSFSVFVGIGLTNFFKPGQGVVLDSGVIAEQGAALAQIQKNAAAAKPFSQILVELIPTNPLGA